MLFTRSRRKFLLQPVVVYCSLHEYNKTIDEATLDYIVSSPRKPPYKRKNSAYYAWNVTCCLRTRVHKSLPRSLLQPFIVYVLLNTIPRITRSRALQLILQLCALLMPQSKLHAISCV